MNNAPKIESDPFERLMSFVKTDNGQRLTVCAFSVLATLLLLLFPGGAVALVVGIPFIFFVPGFTVVRLFFWKNTTAEAKFVLSMGLSLLVVILLGLFLVLTPIGLGSDSSRASLMTFSIVAVAIETFALPANRGVTETPAPEATEPMKADKVVAAMLATALVVSAISLVLIVAADYPSRTYFALTDDNGKVITNETRHLGENLTIVLHMFNDEDGARNFTVVGYGVNDLGPIGVNGNSYTRTLAKGEEWQQTMVFNLTVAGYMRLDFDLYIQEGQQPPFKYGNLHLWLRVI